MQYIVSITYPDIATISNLLVTQGDSPITTTRVGYSDVGQYAYYWNKEGQEA